VVNLLREALELVHQLLVPGDVPLCAHILKVKIVHEVLVLVLEYQPNDPQRGGAQVEVLDDWVLILLLRLKI